MNQIRINMNVKKVILMIVIGLSSFNLYSQQTQKTMANQEIVLKFLKGFNDPSKIQESLALLAVDYKFKNPMVELNSKAAFIALAQEMGKILTGVEVIHTSESENWVATQYVFKSSIPGLENNLASEWFRLENGMIKESLLIYDASAWRKVYERMEN